MKGANAGYFKNIAESFSSSLVGLRLTLKHLFNAWKKRKPVGVQDKNYFMQEEGIVTLQYPYESIPVPDNGRYRLHNEMEDCIVCDLCAKICPVDCIEIEPVKAVEEIGKTSDGTTKRIYAAKFDIDMAKCCYCGLCTTVCPTECLTMTKVYDYSEFDIRNMIYHFTDLTPGDAEEKKKELQEHQLKKAAERNVKKETVAPDQKPILSGTEEEKIILEKEKEDQVEKQVSKPAFKPKIAVPIKKDEALPAGDTSQQKETAPVKPVFKPKISIPPKKSVEATPDKGSEEEAPNVQNKDTSPADDKNPSDPVKPKPFKPVIKLPVPKKSPDDQDKKAES